MNLENGHELQGGKYRIVRVLGQGGFGITYLADNTFLEKKVAIKEFFPKDFCGRDNTSHLSLGTSNNAETVEKLKARFLKEAKNIAKLDYPGIIKIHDIFEENNTAYYVMDYIEGENLNEMVKRNGPLAEAKAIEYIKKTGEALDYIHSRNMTHFDVKPANIMVRKSDDRPVLIDFGLSKQYDAHGDATSTLMQGVSHGYSPIELYNAGAITSFSPQTDVYSLAATLLFLLTGKVSPSASQIIEDGLNIPASIPDNIASAIKAAMQTSRNKRTASISEFLAAVSPAPYTHKATQTTAAKDAPSATTEDTKLISPTPSQPTSTEIFTPETDFNEPENGGKSHLSLYFLVAAAMIIAMICLIANVNRHTDIPEEIVEPVDSVYVVEEVVELADTVAAEDLYLLTNYYVAGIGSCEYYGYLDRFDKPNGWGQATFQSGIAQKYEGFWSHGIPDGECTYILKNGDKFKGTFKDGKYHYGTYTIHSSGEYFVGYFYNGEPSNKGQWYNKNGYPL